MPATVPTNGVTRYGTMMAGSLANIPVSGKAPAGSLYLATDVGPNGTLYMQTTNGWKTIGSGSAQLGLTAITANGAINPHTPASYIFTKAGVAAMTLAAPTATTDDGVVLEFANSTNNQNTITATGLLYTGAAAQNVATWPAQNGGALRLMAYQGKWIVLETQNVVLS